jgi:hypothetical protein
MTHDELMSRLQPIVAAGSAVTATAIESLLASLLTGYRNSGDAERQRVAAHVTEKAFDLYRSRVSNG